MNNETKEILDEVIRTQDTFWQKIIIYVIQWLINQGFTIKYIGDYNEIY